MKKTTLFISLVTVSIAASSQKWSLIKRTKIVLSLAQGDISNRVRINFSKTDRKAALEITYLAPEYFHDINDNSISSTLHHFFDFWQGFIPSDSNTIPILFNFTRSISDTESLYRIDQERINYLLAQHKTDPCYFLPLENKFFALLPFYTDVVRIPSDSLILITIKQIDHFSPDSTNIYYLRLVAAVFRRYFVRKKDRFSIRIAYFGNPRNSIITIGPDEDLDQVLDLLTSDDDTPHSTKLLPRLQDPNQTIPPNP